MSHFRLVVSALLPDGRSIWPNKTLFLPWVISAPGHLGLVSVGVGWSSLGYGMEEYDRVKWSSM